MKVTSYCNGKLTNRSVEQEIRSVLANCISLLEVVKKVNEIVDNSSIQSLSSLVTFSSDTISPEELASILAKLASLMREAGKIEVSLNHTSLILKPVTDYNPDVLENLRFVLENLREQAPKILGWKEKAIEAAGKNRFYVESYVNVLSDTQEMCLKAGDDINDIINKIVLPEGVPEFPKLCGTRDLVNKIN